MKLYLLFFLLSVFFTTSAISSDVAHKSIWVPIEKAIELIPVDIYAGKSQEELDFIHARHKILSNPTEYNAQNPIFKTKDEQDKENYFVYIITNPEEHSIILNNFLSEDQIIERDSFMYLITHPWEYSILIDQIPKDNEYYIRKLKTSFIFID